MTRDIAARWDELQRACESCTRCPLGQTKTNTDSAAATAKPIVFMARRRANRRIYPECRLSDARSAFDKFSRRYKAQDVCNKHTQMPSSEKPRPSSRRTGAVHRLPARAGSTDKPRIVVCLGRIRRCGL